MSKYPWFRVYSNDLLNDRKLARIARACDVPMATVRGVWLTLLAMANDSPERGRLLICESVPVTENEIREDVGLDAATFDALLCEMERLRMIGRGDCVTVTRFLDRNPASDSSTERVRRYREKKKVEAQTVTETLQERSSNALESESESESDHDHDGATAQNSPNTPAMDCYRTLFGKFENGGDLADLLDLEGELGTDRVQNAIRWAHSKGIPADRRMASICTAARNWQGGNIPSPPTANAPPKQPIVIPGFNSTPAWLGGDGGE